MLLLTSQFLQASCVFPLFSILHNQMMVYIALRRWLNLYTGLCIIGSWRSQYWNIYMTQFFLIIGSNINLQECAFSMESASKQPSTGQRQEISVILYHLFQCLLYTELYSRKNKQQFKTMLCQSLCDSKVSWHMSPEQPCMWGNHLLVE